jgi:hypothetical protein
VGFFAGSSSTVVEASTPAQAQDASLAGRYSRHKSRMARKQRAESLAGRDMGELPPVRNPRRKAAAGKSLRKFCETYGKAKFPLKWSPDHLTVIAILQALVLGNDRYALAMPRGSGKTTLCTWAALWALCYGYHSFVVLIAANAKLAKSLIKKIRWELERNDKLAEDFPEICHVLRHVNFTYQSRPMYKGRTVTMKFLQDQIVFPDIEGSPAAGATVNAVGLTGSLRGMQENRPDGSIARPSLILIDDPQTKQSAKSNPQCDHRETLITDDILGMVGPDDSISLIMACTVIRDGDIACRFLDPEKHQTWSKTRVQLLTSFPKSLAKWREYAEVRLNGLRRKDKGAAGNSFYRKHRRELDEGGEVYWKERVEKGDVSALQSAMNMYIDRPSAFWAEGQQDPTGLEDTSAKLTIAQVISKTLPGVPRGKVPTGFTTGTAAIDVQGNLLYWGAMGWSQGFSGHLADYGSWPQQSGTYFSLSNARHTLATIYKAQDESARIYQGLADLIRHLMSLDLQTLDGVHVPIRRILVDARYSTPTIRQFVEQYSNRSLVFPAFGEGRRPVMVTNKPGYESGDGWQIAPAAPGKPYREFIQDSNFWIGFTQDRFRAELGSDAKRSQPKEGETEAPNTGVITLPALAHGQSHEMLGEQVTAEVKGQVKHVSGMRYQTYELLPGRENHLGDVVKMNCAAAASLGLRLTYGVTVAPRPKRQKKPAKYRTL